MADKPHLPWIMVDKDALTDPKLLAAARTLSKRYSISWVDEDGSRGDELDFVSQLSHVTSALRGAVVLLWCYAHDRILPGDILPLDTVTIDALVGIDGFCDAMPPDWLQVVDDGRAIKLPHFTEKNQIVKMRQRRERDNIRQRAKRERDRHTGVTRDNAVTSEGRHADVHGGYRDRDKKEKDSLQSSKKKATEDRNRAMIEARLTPGLNHKAWDEWLAYRTSIRKPFATAQLIRQASVLAEHRGYDAQAAAVKFTIDRGYQGLTDPPATTARVYPIRPTQESALAAIEAAARLTADGEDNQGDTGYEPPRMVD